ncbi:hypothetical protein [Priestia abyssalis]|nr:hypothetical protein [Priestia abyssalis]
MSNVLILSTGPMKIPGRITGDPEGGPPMLFIFQLEIHLIEI